MTILKLSKPNEKQRNFMKAKTRYVAYGGARGGGKSWAVRTKSVLLALKYPKIRILIVRRTYQELRENHILPLTAILKGVSNYNESEKVIKLANGSRIKFGYCDTDKDVLQYQGLEYDILFIDEATQIKEFQFVTINAVVRGANGFPKRTYLTCNPGGVGHSWVKRLFIDKDYTETENPSDYTFIKATVFDNDVLMKNDPAYLQTLQNLPKGIREAWLYGEWDLFEGRFFPEFKRDIHVVEPFAIPNEWRRYRVFDYGLDCFACYFVAINERKKAYFYKEIHEKDLIVSKASELLKHYSEGEDIYQTIAPPDMWNRHKDTGRSTADIFKSKEISLTVADNSLESGCLDMLEWLKIYEDEQGVLASDVQIFSNCKHLIKALSEIQIDSKRPNTYANEPHELTHAVDAMRYFFAKRPKANKKRATETRYNFECERQKENPYGKGLKIKVI